MGGGGQLKLLKEEKPQQVDQAELSAEVAAINSTLANKSARAPPTADTLTLIWPDGLGDIGTTIASGLFVIFSCNANPAVNSDRKGVLSTSATGKQGFTCASFTVNMYTFQPITHFRSATALTSPTVASSRNE